MKGSSSTKSVDAKNKSKVQTKIGPPKRPLLRKEMEKERQEMVAEFEALSMRSRSKTMNRHKMKKQKASKSKKKVESRNSDQIVDVIEEKGSDSMDKSMEKKHDGPSGTTMFVLSSSPVFALNILLLYGNPSVFTIFSVAKKADNSGDSKCSFGEQQEMMTESEKSSVGSRLETMNGLQMKKKRRRKKRKKKKAKSKTDFPSTNDRKVRRYVLCLCVQSVFECSFSANIDSFCFLR